MDPIQGYGLRPRSIGEILDLTFRIYRDGFTTYAPIGIVVGLASFAVTLVWQAIIATLLVDGAQSDPASLLAAAVPMLIGFPLLVLCFLALHAAGCMAVTAVTHDLFFGRPVDAAAAVRKSWRRTLPAAMVSVLCTILSTAGFLMCCVPGIVVTLVLVLAVPLVYLEKRSVTGAINRSLTLMGAGPRGLSIESNWVRALAMGVVVFIVYYVLTLFSQLPLLGVSALPLLGHRTYPTALGPQPQPLVVLLPLQIICTIIHGLFFAIIFIPWTLLYYDIRVRHEGLDLEVACAQLGSGQAAAGPSAGAGPDAGAGL